MKYLNHFWKSDKLDFFLLIFFTAYSGIWFSNMVHELNWLNLSMFALSLCMAIIFGKPLYNKIKDE